MGKSIRKYILWTFLALPAIYIVILYAKEGMSYGDVLNQTGLWSATFLLPALAATPFRRLFPKAMWPRKLMYHRRALGVTTFGYAVLHTGAYIQRKWGGKVILKETQGAGLLTGWIAVFIFLIMALTSNNLAVKKLGPRWQSLHRLVYMATALVFAHWFLSSDYPGAAYQFLGAVLLIEVLRFVRRKP